MPELYRRPGSPYWYAYLKDPRELDGIKRKSTKCDRKGPARSAAAALQAELDEEIRLELRHHDRTDPNATLFSEAAEDFIMGSDLTPRTRRGYVSLLAVILASPLGDFALPGFGEEEIWVFIRHRRQAGASDDTVRRALSFISAVYKFQNRAGTKIANPLQTFDRSVLKQSKPRDRHLRVNQFQRVLDSCESDEHRRILIVLVGSGMRTSEVLDLTWEQVDLKNKVIIIGQAGDVSTKTYRSRRIALFPEVVDALTAQQLHRKKTIKSETSDGCLQPSDLVFPSNVTGERRYDLNYLRKVIKKRTGLKSFTIHALRATYASWLLQRGNDPLRVRDSLGHSTLSTTTRYAHHLADQALNEIRDLGFPLTAQKTAQNVGISDTPQKTNKKKR